MLATLAACFMVLSGYFLLQLRAIALGRSAGSSPFSRSPTIFFTSAVTLKGDGEGGGVRSSDITFANSERGKPAESKAQIAHFKST